MELTRLATTAATVAILGLGALGFGGGVAAAQPPIPVPLEPGHGRGPGHCPPRCGDPHNGPDKWNYAPKYVNTNERWDDRWGAPPWGYGAPPPVYWNGGPPPQSIDYWGYQANPIWNDGFRQWGIWLFGFWIPIFGVGFN